MMCRQVKEGNIIVAFERDISLRATEIFIVNHDRDGNEGQGIKVICRDSGKIEGGVDLIDGVDITGHAEMRS